MLESMVLSHSRIIEELKQKGYLREEKIEYLQKRIEELETSKNELISVVGSQGRRIEELEKTVKHLEYIIEIRGLDV